MKPSWLVTKLMLAVGWRPLGLEQVRGAVDAAREFAALVGVAAPETPHRIAVAVVPFRPFHREMAQLVSAGARIPGLGDQLGAFEPGIAADACEQAVALV